MAGGLLYGHFVGWYKWDAEQFDGKGHFEVIVGAKKSRLWHVFPDRVSLIWEGEGCCA